MSYKKHLSFFLDSRRIYDSQFLDESSEPHEFTCVYNSCENEEELIKSLVNIYCVYPDFFEVVLILENPSVNTKRLINIFPHLFVIQMLKQTSFKGAFETLKNEIQTPYFLYFTDSVKLSRFLAANALKTMKSFKTPICLCPLYIHNDGWVYPSIRIPMYSDDRHVKIECAIPPSSFTTTLYPIKGIGLYNTEFVKNSPNMLDWDFEYSLIDYFILAWCKGYSVLFTDLIGFNFTDTNCFKEDFKYNHNYKKLRQSVYSFKKDGDTKVRLNYESLLYFNPMALNRYKKRYKECLFDYEYLVRNFQLYDAETKKAILS